MRFRPLLLISFLFFASSAFAVERWILISGTVSNFHTDARVFNPSFDKDIVISATFLPQGNGDNSARQPVTFTVPKRQMRIMNDVTTELFASTQLGGIRFVSSDEFEVTSRIYAISSACTPGATGTLGQFGPGLGPDAAKAKGTLLQLRSSGVRGQTGTFRTNLGALNPTATTVKVSWTLYDKNNAIVNTGTTDMPPLAVIGPTSMGGTFFFNPGTADISDAWVSYTTTPATSIFAYASVLDNGTEDQTFVPAVDDKGIPPTTPAPTQKSFTVTLRDFSIAFSPAPNNLKVGDIVTLTINNNGPSFHGLTVSNPSGIALVDVTPTVGRSETATFTIDAMGTWGYFCNNSECGSGHASMAGVFTVGKDNDDPGRGY